MIALLSPAKTFADVALPFALDATAPQFDEDAHKLAASAGRLSVKKLAHLMRISPRLAAINAGRFRAFEDQPARPAVQSFAGDVYRGFDAASLDADALHFADAHVRILSGLYGLLRPTDAIRPYRLEMGTPWAPRVGSLYRYWGTRLSRHLETELAAEGSVTILNLASEEYWRAVGPHLSKDVRVVTVDFRDDAPGGPRFNTFVAKKARGALARYLCDHCIERVEDLKGFDGGGHAYDEAGSTGETLRFLRH